MGGLFHVKKQATGEVALADGGSHHYGRLEGGRCDQGFGLVTGAIALPVTRRIWHLVKTSS